MLLYSLGNVKANEKDVAMLRLLGKKPSDIMWVFALMALAPSLIALVAAYAGGPLLSAWVGATFAHAIGTTLNPPALSVWAFFIVLIPLAIVPLLASILSVLRIQRCEPVDIFKRNLI
jgi:ABC-type lipoprotein release transport system permease subunit